MSGYYHTTSYHHATLFCGHRDIDEGCAWNCDHCRAEKASRKEKQQAVNAEQDRVRIVALLNEKLGTRLNTIEQKLGGLNLMPVEEESMKDSSAVAIQSLQRGAKLGSASIVNKKLVKLVRTHLSKHIGYPEFFDTDIGQRVEAFLLPMAIHYFTSHVDAVPNADTIMAVAELAMEAAGKDFTEVMIAEFLPMFNGIANMAGGSTVQRALHGTAKKKSSVTVKDDDCDE